MRKQNVILVSFSILSIIILAAACTSQAEKEEQLAKVYCSSCHTFPDPSLLNKKLWEESVLPAMAFRMGFDNLKMLEEVPPNDIQTVLTTVPARPIISDKEWKEIEHYYLSHAPDSLIVIDEDIPDTVQQFSTMFCRSVKVPLVTLLKTDTVNHWTFTGDRLGSFFKLNEALEPIDSFQLNSPPSCIIEDRDNFLLTEMGIMDPNDQARGKLIHINKQREIETLIDSLKRPVHVEKADLNDDGDDDYVISEFGNFTGRLAIYDVGGDTAVRHILTQTPGARKAMIKDFDHDGRKDILAMMAQGDERLVLYTNKGDFSFEEKILLRFPPVYGFNYFEIADFNRDGYFDILTTNGDNADYSVTLKPYHAVRIFENDGANNFREAWSFLMPGASQAVARDFDEDGDLDIAAISFFPDFESHPERGFIYFEDKGQYQFLPHITSMASAGRWLVMEAADYDGDGDCDILLGATNFPGLGATKEIYQFWREQQVPLLILKNKRVH